MDTRLNLTTFDHFGAGRESGQQARRIAAKRFEQALSRARKNRFWGKLTGRRGQMDMMAARPVGNVHAGQGIRMVPIGGIAGSESRNDDFDADFNPLKSHLQDRWIGIAAARRTGVALPPVELVRSGDRYYVRDGHHRISVAKAMGQLEIEARIVN